MLHNRFAACLATGLGALVISAGPALIAAPASAQPTIAVPPFQAADAYAPVEAAPDGTPKMDCNQYHDGEKVKTSVGGKERRFVCGYHDPIFGKGYWVWTELLLQN